MSSRALPLATPSPAGPASSSASPSPASSWSSWAPSPAPSASTRSTASRSWAWLGTYQDPVTLGVLLASCIGLALAASGARNRMQCEAARAPRTTNVLVRTGLVLAAFSAFLFQDFEGGLLVPGPGLLGAG